MTESDQAILHRLHAATGAETATDLVRHALRFGAAWLAGWSHEDVLKAHVERVRELCAENAALKRHRKSERALLNKHGIKPHSHDDEARPSWQQLNEALTNRNQELLEALKRIEALEGPNVREGTIAPHVELYA